MSLISLNVRFQGQPGPHLLAVSFSQFDSHRTHIGLAGCEIAPIPPDERLPIRYLNDPELAGGDRVLPLRREAVF
jgi:hypothetical protein